MDAVKDISVFSLTLPRETPYLGIARKGEEANAQGYFVRKGNRTVYPSFERTVIVRIETGQGVIGWGETYGLVAPGAVAAIIIDLLAGFTIGRDPADPSAIYDDLYDLMRVRGYSGGFYVDALAAIDIALWDIAGKQAGKSIVDLLGVKRHQTIPAYLSGLPEPTRAARAELAQVWQSKGFNAFKFAAPVADDGPIKELETLRTALGVDAKIAVDMHWNQTADQALAMIGEMEAHGLWFAEAPVRTEDIDGLQKVASGTETPIAVGEEWRTDHDMRLRTKSCKIAIVQPEMGHTGITNFVRMGKMADELGLDLMPHATIGSGIFLAASLLASQSLRATKFHEFQHSIFEHNRRLIVGDMDCENGIYSPPSGPGLGVGLSEEAMGLLKAI